MNKKMRITGAGVTIGQYVCFLSMIILLLAGMTVLLSSCEKEVDEEIGKTVTLRFSSRGLGYGSEEAVTRGWDNGPRILETVDIPFEGGWTMSVDLVEEGLSRVRSVSDGLVDGAQVLVIVYDSSDTYVTSDVYTYSSSTTDLSGGGSLTVAVPNTYRFVLCSYNSTTTVPAYSSSLTVSPIYDLLWGGTARTLVTDANQKIEVSVSHKLMKVKLMTAVTGGTHPVLSNVSASLTTNYNANLTVLTGDVSKGDAVNAYTFTANDADSNMGNSPAAILNSDYGIAYTGGDNPFYVQIASVTLTDDGNTVTQTGLVASFTKELSAGRSYALQVNFKRGVPFAGSNIYWDPTLVVNGVAGALTFKPTGYKGPENYYQGVFFKFGSLIGMSPVRPLSAGTLWSNTNIPVYGFDVNAGVWVKKASVTAAYNGNNNSLGITAASYAGIRFFDPTLTPNNLQDRSINYIHDYLTDNAQAGIGDICRWIGAHGGPEGYHIPVSQDFQGVGSGSSYAWGSDSQAQNWYKGSGGFANLTNNYYPTGNVDADGKTNLNTYADGSDTAGSALLYNTIPFPVSGYRSTTGSLNHVGDYGYYWSGSVVTGSSDNMSLNNLEVSPGEYSSPFNGFSVRCVKN